MALSFLTRKEPSPQNERGEYIIPKSCINKADDNFFRTTKLLFNYVQDSSTNTGTS